MLFSLPKPLLIENTRGAGGGGLTLIWMGIFGAAHGWVGGGGAKRAAPPKISDTYPTMMKIGTDIPYLEKIQKIYESRDTPSEFCCHQHFFTEN